MITAVATPRADGVPAEQVPIGQHRLLVEPEGRWEFMTTPDQSQQERALETGAVYQDAEGRRTTDPGSGAANADSEADRNAEHLRRGEVGPHVPEE